MRSQRYRYIYYEYNSLEELYDHQSDPNEFYNLAYNNDYKEIVRNFRNELVERAKRDRVALEEIAKKPVGYTIQNNKVHSDTFIPMEKLPLEK